MLWLSQWCTHHSLLLTQVLISSKLAFIIYKNKFWLAVFRCKTVYCGEKTHPINTIRSWTGIYTHKLIQQTNIQVLWSLGLFWETKTKRKKVWSDLFQRQIPLKHQHHPKKERRIKPDKERKIKTHKERKKTTTQRLTPPGKKDENNAYCQQFTLSCFMSCVMCMYAG